MFAKQPKLINGEQIKITDKCIGCGIWSKVCPIGNFYIQDKIAKRKSSICEFCLACAHKANVMSISDIDPDARYQNADISLKEIIDSKYQK